MSRYCIGTAYDVAKRFSGLHEIKGATDHPFIVWCLSICGLPNEPDETAWCSAFTNGIAYICGLPRSKRANARSWLTVGAKIGLEDAKCGYDIVVLKRGTGEQPGPDVLNAPGHVGFYHGHTSEVVYILGGNQSDAVGVSPYPVSRILGVRRLA